MGDRATEVALFRYALIRPGDLGATRGRVVRELAAGVHTGPGGVDVCVGRSTADQRIRAWQAGWFEALKPKPRALSSTVPQAPDRSEASRLSRG